MGGCLIDEALSLGEFTGLVGITPRAPSPAPVDASPPAPLPAVAPQEPAESAPATTADALVWSAPCGRRAREVAA